MADQPSLHIDTDWKRQAQEEKKRLAEEEERKRQQAAAAAAAAPPAAPPGGIGMGGMPGGAATAAGAPSSAARGATDAGAGAAPRDRGGYPPASFGTLVQSLVTQILFYLGELAPRGTEPQLNLDMAKHNIDMLGVIEEKTRGNLSPEEQRLLDGALYESRMRYVNVAQQYAVV